MWQIGAGEDQGHYCDFSKDIKKQNKVKKRTTKRGGY